MRARAHTQPAHNLNAHTHKPLHAHIQNPQTYTKQHTHTNTNINTNKHTKRTVKLATSFNARTTVARSARSECQCLASFKILHTATEHSRQHNGELTHLNRRSARKAVTELRPSLSPREKPGGLKNISSIDTNTITASNALRPSFRNGTAPAQGRAAGS